jgi:trimeric autotransporter adhesin
MRRFGATPKTLPWHGGADCKEKLMDRNMRRWRSIAQAAAGVASIATLTAGCGGGGGSDPPAPPATATISGVVADGPLQGAIACYDSNDNARCDSGEPVSGASDTNGNYSITVPAADAGNHAVIVDVPATAVDRDTGSAVGTAFVLKSPATGSAGSQTVFVSPLTTLVVDTAGQQGLVRAEAEAQVKSQLGLTASPLANYVAAADAQAAKLAVTINKLIIDIRTVAAAANVPAEQAQTLVNANVTGNLPSLAAQVAAGSGTPQAVAAQVSAAVLADANLNAGTVVAQAQVQAQLAAPLQSLGAPGPFVSLRRFTYTDANNFSYQVNVGDSSQVDSQGRFAASEVRKTLQGGAEQFFNRNRAYWTGTQWKVCDRQWQVSLNVNQTATAPSSSRFCDGSVSQSRVMQEDVSGRRMADVVAAMRAYPLPDSDGLPAAWGPNPALLGEAVFPAGSTISSRATTAEIGNTDSYGLLDRVSVRGSDGVRRHLASFDDENLDGSSIEANFRDANVTVTGGNAVFLDQFTIPQPADATLRNVERWLVGFANDDTDRVRFFKCSVISATGVETGCVAMGDGTIGDEQTQGDARVLRFTSGYPVALLKATNRMRFLIERHGAVLRGSTDLQRTFYNQRPNTTAWIALRDQLGLPAHAEPVAPAGSGPFKHLRIFTFTDAANYNWRTTYGDSSQLDAQGYYLVSEDREIRSAGVLQPFQRNRLYWTGSQWFDCGNSGVVISRQNSVAPFDSVFCQSYADEGRPSVRATLDGMRMSDVLRDLRRYGTNDGTFQHRNWGPDPAVHTQLASAFFPPGSEFIYGTFVRQSTPPAIASGAGDRVRVPPADTSQPFDTWPFAASLDEMIARYPGNINGGTLNGATAFWVWGYDLPVPPAPEYTTRVEIRVAFDTNGQRARFYRNYKSASTGFTTAYVTLLDTSYSIETIGGKRLLRFAAMPENFERDFLFERRFAEHNGAVHYAFKDSVTTQPQRNVRLNGTARDALFGVLGLN